MVSLIHTLPTPIIDRYIYDRSKMVVIGWYYVVGDSDTCHSLTVRHLKILKN
jgi:hypothetical protein